MAQKGEALKNLETGSVVSFNRPWRSSRESELVEKCLASGKRSGDGPYTHAPRRILEDLTGSTCVLPTTSCTAVPELADRLLRLPLHMGLDDRDILRVGEAVKRFYRS